MEIAWGDYQDAEYSSFNDKDWETVGLPHSFSILYFMSNDFYVGYGWYRKELSLSADDLKRNIFLEFDGVFLEAEIFINGQFIKAHMGGYTGFTVDISSAVRRGDNMIAVRVNNLWKPDVAPRAGEHVFSSGIYRNVRLVMKSSAFIDWCGTWVTTPDLQVNQGEASVVKVCTDVCNRTNKTTEYKLVTEVIDKAGKFVASVSHKEKIGANTTTQFVQHTQSVKRPVLWSPENPVLYKVVSSLYQGKKMIDREETSFGFRWMEWTADKGFFLNGEHRFLRGANVHQDHAGWGDAVTESGMKRDVRMMKKPVLTSYVVRIIRMHLLFHGHVMKKACSFGRRLLSGESVVSDRMDIGIRVLIRSMRKMKQVLRPVLCSN